MISKTETWPAEIHRFLESNFESFIGWCCGAQQVTSAGQFDSLIYEMRDILKKYSLRGYHCSKLINEEILEIKNNGMSLQNRQSLSRRVDSLNKIGLIDENIASQLKNENQCNDSNRANMLWFCFFEPHLAGQHGIERFFKSWGGEALYNFHERNPITGPVLRKIGIPCIVYADVPMKSIPDSRLPDFVFIRIFLNNKGYNVNNSMDYEGYSVEALTSDCILNVIEYPSSQFVSLTSCNNWEFSLEVTA